MGHRVFLLSLALLFLIGMGASGAVGSNSVMRSMVGSRPPSCAGRCWWCGTRRCVAVQVPITPLGNKVVVHGIGAWRRPTTGGASAAAALQQQQQQEVSSYDDHSNYKPLSWRCKCGGGA